MKILTFFFALCLTCLADDQPTLELYAVHPNGGVLLEMGLDHTAVQGHAENYLVLEETYRNDDTRKLLVYRKPLLKITKITETRSMILAATVSPGATEPNLDDVTCVWEWRLPKEFARKIDEAKGNAYSNNLVAVLNGKEVMGRISTGSMYSGSCTVSFSSMKLSDLPIWRVKLGPILQTEEMR